MSSIFTVSPDFMPDHLSGWYIFNAWLQKETALAIHLELYDDFKSQKDAIQNDSIDLIYANPSDAAMLMREKGFQPLVKAAGKSDEAIVAVNAGNTVKDVAYLEEGIKVAFTDDPEVYMVGMMMLESSDLDKTNTHPVLSDTYVLVAKHLLKGDADVGFFLAEAYDSLSSIIKRQLKILVRSQVDVIHHSLMIGPRLFDQKEVIQNALLGMNDCEKGTEVLKGLGFQDWDAVGQDEMEFMIDLMDTLIT